MEAKPQREKLKLLLPIYIVFQMIISQTLPWLGSLHL